MIYLFVLIEVFGIAVGKAQEACGPSLAKKNIEKILSAHRSNGLPLENMEDQYACVFEKQSSKVGINFLRAFEVFDSTQNVPAKSEQSCLRESDQGEKITKLELLFRKAKCQSDAEYLNSNEVDLVVKERIIKDIKSASDEFVELNRDYFRNSEKIKRVQDTLVARANEYRRDFKCANGVSIQAGFLPKGVWENLITADEAETGEDMVALNRVATEKFESKKVAFEETRLRPMRMNGSLFCGGVKKTANPRRGVSSESAVREFAVDIDDLKQPNEWRVSQTRADDLLKKIENHPDFSKNRDCFKNIETIEIQAASSKLRNNKQLMDEVYEAYPETKSAIPSQWDFHALAYARAREIEDKLVKSLIKKHGLARDPALQGKRDGMVKAVLGENGTGAAGDCPYQLKPVGQKFRVEGIQKTSQLAENLNQSQKARVVIRFTDKCRVDKRVLTSQPLGHMMFTEPCLKFEYKCQ